MTRGTMDHIAQLRNSSNQWAKQSFVLILVEISPASGSEEHFVNFVMYSHYFLIISLWKRTGALHLNKLESPSPKTVLCQVCLKLAQRFFWWIFFHIKNMIDTLFYLIIGKYQLRLAKIFHYSKPANSEMTKWSRKIIGRVHSIPV